MSRSPEQEERLDALRAAIDSGEYEVPALEVADAVLEQWRRFDVVDPREAPRDGDSAQSTSIDTDGEASSR